MKKEYYNKCLQWDKTNCPKCKSKETFIGIFNEYGLCLGSLCSECEYIEFNPTVDKVTTENVLQDIIINLLDNDEQENK